MLDWLSEHQTLLAWLFAASLVLFLATLIAAPILVTRIPPDYFTHAKRPPGMWAHRHRALRWTLLAVRTIVAVVVMAAGIAMLVLPGQGLLTLLIGFFLLDFPGKYRLERRIIARPRILKAVNALRRRRGRQPLQTPRPPTAPA